MYLFALVLRFQRKKRDESPQLIGSYSHLFTSLFHKVQQNPKFIFKISIDFSKTLVIFISLPKFKTTQNGFKSNVQSRDTHTQKKKSSSESEKSITLWCKHCY